MCNISNNAHHVCANSSCTTDKLQNACGDCRRNCGGKKIMKAEELRKQLLNVLGVEPDEAFYTEQSFGMCKHRYNSKFKYFEYYHNVDTKWCFDNEIVKDLFSGRAKFIGKFWKPEQKEMYFYVSGEGEICSLIWWGDTFDLSTWHLQNCFKTKEEAEENKDRVVELLRSDAPAWKVAEMKMNNE